MKMNRLFLTGALLLGSLSALGLSTTSNEIKPFEISDAKAANLEVLRAEEQAPQEKPITINKTTDPFVYNPSKESGNLADNLSKALVQTKAGAKKDTTDIRFVAAVRIGLSDKDGNKVAEIDDGGQFGFHIKYDVDPSNVSSVEDIVNVYAETDRYYSSIVGGGTRYIANDFTTKTGLSMGAWTYENLGEPDNYNGYNAFITMELRNVPNTYSSFIEAQPYFVGESDTIKKFATHSKKADTSNESLFFATVGGNVEKMETNSGNTNEKMFTTTLNKGETLLISDSYGEPIKNYDNKDLGDNLNTSTGVYTAIRDGVYTAYYKINSKSIWLGVPDDYVIKVGDTALDLTQDTNSQNKYYVVLPSVTKGEVIELHKNGVKENAQIKSGNEENNLVALDGNITVHNNAKNVTLYVELTNNGYQLQLGGYHFERTIYFINNANWTNVYAHMFAAGIDNGGWPGEIMTETEMITPNGYKVYEYTFTNDKLNKIVFNNGLNGDNELKTYNLSVNDSIDKPYYNFYEGAWQSDANTKDAPKNIKYFVDETKWGTLHVKLSNDVTNISNEGHGIDITKGKTVNVIRKAADNENRKTFAVQIGSEYNRILVTSNGACGGDKVDTNSNYYVIWNDNNTLRCVKVGC